jgi:hypothetical protein
MTDHATALTALLEKLLSQAFVAGQMDAAATEQEKWHVGRGGQLRVLSRRAYALAEATADELCALLRTGASPAPIRAHVEGCPLNLRVPVDLCACGGRDFVPDRP